MHNISDENGDTFIRYEWMRTFTTDDFTGGLLGPSTQRPMAFRVKQNGNVPEKYQHYTLHSNP